MITIQCSNFNLEQIANSGQCFRFFKINDIIPRYNIVAFGKVLEVFQIDDIIHFNCSQEDFDNIWFPYFDLSIWYEKFGKSIDPNDNFLTAAYQYGSGIRILQQDLWEIMVSFIISQRKSIPAIKTSIERLCMSYGDRIEGTEYYTFPTPDQLLYLNEKANCGLGYRLNYIKTLAQRVVNGEISLKQIKNMDYEMAKKTLLSIRGIGEKVANCILLFGLGYVDAFPVDVWIQRILNKYYSDGFPLNQYRGYNGILQQYMFYYIKNNNEVIL